MKGKHDLPRVKLAFFFYILRPGVSHNFHGISRQLLPQSTSNHPPPRPLPSLRGEAAPRCTDHAKFHCFPVMKQESFLPEVILRWEPDITFPSWDTLTMVPRRKAKLIYLPKLHVPFSGLPGTQCCEVRTSARAQYKRLYVD